MNTFRIILLVMLGLIFLIQPAVAAQLGDKAPPLDIGSWITGSPVDLADGKGQNIYVIEFWATWCFFCVEAMPHLSKLQKRYADRGVTIVGISNESEADVQAFIRQRNPSIQYTIATDKDNRTVDAYLRSFGIEGIPHAFIIDHKGRIVWEGHPMEALEDALLALLDTKDVPHRVIDRRTDLAALARSYPGEPDGFDGIRWGEEYSWPETLKFSQIGDGVVAYSPDESWNSQFFFIDNHFIAHLELLDGESSIRHLNRLSEKHGWAYFTEDAGLQSWIWVGKTTTIMLMRYTGDGSLARVVLDTAKLKLFDPYWGG